MGVAVSGGDRIGPQGGGVQGSGPSGSPIGYQLLVLCSVLALKACVLIWSNYVLIVV